MVMASNSIVETLNVAVLPWPARLAQNAHYAVFRGQSHEGLTYELGAVVRSAGNR